MNENNEQLNMLGKEFSLTREERIRMRRTIISYMEMKPQRAPLVAAPQRQWHWSVLFSARALAALLVLAVFGSSAGISYAAENALPGDPLYSIKTNVNEQIAGALAVTPAQKSTWAAGVAGERIKEAATLAAEGKLNTGTQKQLQQSFNEHADIAISAIAAGASSSPEITAQAAVSFEAQLSAYNQVLASVATSGEDAATLAAAIDTKQAQVASLRQEAEARIETSGGAAASSTDALAASIGEAAREQLQATVALAEQNQGALDASSSAQVTLQLQDTSSTIDGGDAMLAHNASLDALASFKTALSAAEKVGVFLKTSSAIHQKTGLVIGQPETPSPAVASVKGRAEGKGKPAAAALMVSATLTATSSTSTASTSAQTKDATSHDNSGGDSKSGDGSNSGPGIVPIAVPLPTLP